MKVFQNLILLLIPVFFISCSGDFESYGDDSPEVQAEIKSLKISFTDGTISVNQEITFQVLSDQNKDITTLCKIFVDDIEISGNKFTPDKVGEYSVYATYKTLKSDTKKMTVTSSSSSETKDFKQNVLIEDVTGAWCQHCPRVSYRLEQLKKQTSQLVVVAAHYGDALQYSKVSELSNLFGLKGYPWAQLNRTQRWNEQSGSVTALVDNKAKAGVALESTLSEKTLTLKFKSKFAEDFSDLKYVVFLLEDDIKLDQSQWAGGDYGYGRGTDRDGDGRMWLINFNHTDVLRHAFTSGPLGDAIPLSSTKKGSTFEKSFTYEVPTSFNKEKLKLVGIVVKKDNKVINVRLSEIGKTQAFEEL